MLEQAIAGSQCVVESALTSISYKIDVVFCR